MFCLKILIVVLAFQLIEAGSMKSIKVMVSQTEPFAYFDAKNQSLMGLDVEIVNNFAKKFKLKVKYIVLNESLNELFTSENRIEPFTKS